jgi:alpha-1,2-mannosyltransferase
MPCDVFVDTMGVGFAYPWIKWLFGLPIYSYTHYPIVSSDMLKDVESEEEQFNNKAKGSQKDFKVYYYRALIILYRFCGKFAD